MKVCHACYWFATLRISTNQYQYQVLFAMIFERTYDIEWFALITTYRRLTSSQLQTMSTHCSCVPSHSVIWQSLWPDWYSHVTFICLSKQQSTTTVKTSECSWTPLLISNSQRKRKIVVNLRLWVPNNGVLKKKPSSNFRYPAVRVWIIISCNTSIDLLLQ